MSDLNKTIFFLHANTRELARIESILEANDGEFTNLEMEERFSKLNFLSSKNLDEALRVRLEILKKVKLNIDERIEYFQAWKARELKKVKAIEEVVEYALLKRHIEANFEDRGAKVVKNPDKLPEDIDVNNVPDAFVKVIPAQKQVMKVQLLKAVKEKAAGTEHIKLETDRKRVDFWG